MQMPEAFLIGEVQGHPVEGFHFRNSPSQVAKASLMGKKLIMRTSVGSQRIVKSHQADELLACSFSNARATLEYIKESRPEKLTFVVTSPNNGDEDLALADYLTNNLIQNDTVSVEPFLKRVKESELGKLFQRNENTSFPAKDLETVLNANHFPFIMKVSHNNKDFIMTSEFIGGACSEKN